MSIRKFFTVPDHTSFEDVALLLLRLVTGIAFMMHGSSKIQDPFNWMGPDPLAPPPFQALAALSEFGGGLAWALGLLTPLASLGIASTMTVATWLHMIKRGDPFVSMTGGPAYELPAIFLIVAIVFIALGPGRFSADRMLFGRRER